MGTALKGKGIAVAVLAVCAAMLATVVPGARAQGSRKDDVVFNAEGQPMAGATVRICQANATGEPCSPLAAIYSNAALTQSLANPITADGLGNYSFYAAPGRYMIEISGPGITPKQIPDVILPSDPSAPTFTSVTTTSGISAFSLSLTGNLTVNGSAAVVGSLTVGGAPVPSTNQDNQWTAGQRFKGPIPYRDVTAYMPAGGCASSDIHDPQTTGSIGSGTATLTLTSAMDFKTGCGVTVLGAGPTTTLPAPGSCTVSSASRTSNVVTVTCSAAHSIPAATWGGSFASIVLASCSDSSMNGTHPVQTTTSTTLTFNSTGSNGSATGCTATLEWGYAHGTTGSTTYDYKVSAIDQYFGYSPASPDIQITNGNATLDQFNYNWITWAPAADSSGKYARMWAIYKSTDGGSTWSCVGTSFTSGYADEGINNPCPVFMSSTTPPASAGPQALFTTISSGGGTTTLTLAANASNTATSRNVYHDESSFVNQCLTDANTDQASPGFNYSNSGYGCYVPYGQYFINGPLVTDTLSGSINGGLHLVVAGRLSFLTTPWFISKNGPISIEGVGNSGGFGQFQSFPTTRMWVGPNVPAGFVLMGDAHDVTIKGIAFGNLQGHGIWIGQTPGTSVGPTGVDIDNFTASQSSTGGGANVWIDANSYAIHFNNTVLTARSNGTGYDNVKFSMSSYNDYTTCCVYFDNLSMVYRGFKFDAPGGNWTQGGIGMVIIHNAIVENLAHNSSGVYGLIIHDSSAAAPGTNTGGIPINGISIENLTSSDSQDGPSNYTLFQENGPYAGGYINGVNVLSSGGWAGALSCAPQTTACNGSAPNLGGYFSVNSSTFSSKSVGSGLDVENIGIYAQNPISMMIPYNQLGQNPPKYAWAQLLPTPTSFQVNSTGTTGSLPDATYCMAVEGKDSQSAAGVTFPTRTICQTVSNGGANNGVIQVQWQYGGSGSSFNGAYSGFRFFFCSTAGSSCTPNQYLDLGTSGFPYYYNFSSTSGALTGSLTTTSTAYLSWLSWERGTTSCLECVSSDLWPLGIGTVPTPGNGVKLDVNGGTIRGQGGLQAGSDSAFNASPRASYNAFLPNLTSSAATYQRMTPDKGVTVTRLQLVLGTPGAGCTTQATVSLTDGTNSVTLTTANGTSIYDSGAVSQSFAAGANLDVKIATAAGGCSTAPQNANVTAQYRMQ